MENINKQKFQCAEINECKKKNSKQFDNTLDKQVSKCYETIKKCDDFSNYLNKESRNQKVRMRGLYNEMHTTKNNEHLIMDSRESLKSKKFDECKISELLISCSKHTEDWLKVMKKIKKDLDINNSKTCSSNSSIKSENDLERPLIIVKGIKKNLTDLTEYIIHLLNEKMKNEKIKSSRDILSNLKDTNCRLSELCDTLVQQMNNE